MDAYDSGVSSAYPDRWSRILTQPAGLGVVLAFAKAHNKPLSIPEWGIQPSSQGEGGGDDAAYVNGIAGIVANNDVAYQSYFFHDIQASALASYPQSLAAYRNAFGGGADNEPAGSQWTALSLAGGTPLAAPAASATVASPNRAPVTPRTAASKPAAAKVVGPKKSKIKSTTNRKKTGVKCRAATCRVAPSAPRPQSKSPPDGAPSAAR